MAAKKKVVGKPASRTGVKSGVKSGGRKGGRTARRGPDSDVPRCTATDNPNECRIALGPVPTIERLHRDVHEYMFCMCVYLHDLRDYIENLENRIRTHCCPTLPSPGPTGVPKPPPPPF